MRVLHLLSQRPGRTGSGVTLEALVTRAGGAGWTQAVALGTPADDPRPAVGDLPADAVHPLRFGTDALPFALPGMSDVMPYPSSRWADLGAEDLARYRDAWREHVGALVAAFRPDVIHSHHVWLLSSLVKDVAPDVPVVMHSHATGIRQMVLCPALADEVRRGCARNERLLVLTRHQGEEAARSLSLPPERVTVVGAGYHRAHFHPRGRTGDGSLRLLYVGKYSRAKGLPWLLDAFERVAADEDALTLHVAGTGAGAEADALRARMETLAPRVVLHGPLAQPDLADLMRRCELFVLPSLYEGFALVVVEAAACGCRVVGTDLPAVQQELAAHLGDGLALVPPPRRRDLDTPYAEDLPGFVDALEAAIRAALARPALGDVTTALAPFTWDAVFRRVERVWREVVQRET